MDVGVIPMMAPYLLPALVPVIAQRHPAAELRLRELRTDELVAELRGGRLDLGVLALPMHDSNGLTSEPLHRDPFVVAVATDHPLAVARRPLDMGARPVLGTGAAKTVAR